MFVRVPAGSVPLPSTRSDIMIARTARIRIIMPPTMQETSYLVMPHSRLESSTGRTLLPTRASPAAVLSTESLIPAEAPPAACKITPGFRSNGIFYSEEMLVRDSELDAFGVVNNSVFTVYTEHGRSEALAMLGFPVHGYARAGTPLAVSEVKLTYLQPLRSRDRFVVTVRVVRVTAARVVLAQDIIRLPNAVQRDEQVVLRAETTVVFLKGNYQPGRVPADARAALEELQRLSDASKTL